MNAGDRGPGAGRDPGGVELGLGQRRLGQDPGADRPGGAAAAGRHRPAAHPLPHLHQGGGGRDADPALPHPRRLGDARRRRPARRARRARRAGRGAARRAARPRPHPVRPGARDAGRPARSRRSTPSARRCCAASRSRPGSRRSSPCSRSARPAPCARRCSTPSPTRSPELIAALADHLSVDDADALLQEIAHHRAAFAGPFEPALPRRRARRRSGADRRRLLAATVLPAADEAMLGTIVALCAASGTAGPRLAPRRSPRRWRPPIPRRACSRSKSALLTRSGATPFTAKIGTFPAKALRTAHPGADGAARGADARGSRRRGRGGSASRAFERSVRAQPLRPRLARRLRGARSAPSACSTSTT